MTSRVDYVYVGQGAFSQLEELIKGKRTIFITDSNVSELYSDFFSSKQTIVMPQGEENKNLETYQKICIELLKMGADRKTFIVGFGGGVVTDMAGFVASTYMRGIGFGFVATTLLAQIDAALGGKNGVDFNGYKNILGAFQEPKFVLCDPIFFETLPKKELTAGYGELVKYALLRGEYILAKNEYVTRCVEAKMDVVRSDFKESGQRKMLNLGHTFAHAVEKCTREYNHGEAVGIGLSVMAKISQGLGFLQPSNCKRVIEMIKSYGLPTEVPQDIELNDLISAIFKDKKRSGNSIDMVLLRAFGDPFIHTMEFDAVRDAYISYVSHNQ